MSDEQPVLLKRRKLTVDKSTLKCIVHYENSPKGEVLTQCSEVSFASIRKALSLRQSQTSIGNRADEICASVPTELDVTLHGYHRWCYKRFTNTSKCVSSKASETDVVSASVERRSSRRCDNSS